MYSLQDIIKGDESIVFDPKESRHSGFRKVWLNHIDLYMIARFVKEVNSNEQLLIDLKESDIDMFISDLETTEIGKIRLKTGDIPYANVNNKPFKEDSIAGRLSEHGITYSIGNMYTCFSRDNNSFIEMFVKASEAKRIIYQLLSIGCFTNEGIVYMINTNSNSIKKPRRQEDLFYWNIAENQNIPIIAKNNVNNLDGKKQVFAHELSGEKVECISKRHIERIRELFKGRVHVTINGQNGFLKCIDPSSPLDKQGKDIILGVGSDFIPVGEFLNNSL